MGWKNYAGSIIMDSICGSVLVAHETDDSFLKSSPLLCDPVNISETAVYYQPRSSSSLVLDVIMAGCSEDGALVGERLVLLLSVGP